MPSRWIGLLVVALVAVAAARSTWIPRIPNRSPVNHIPNADGSAMCVRVGHVGCSGTPSPGGGNDFGQAFVLGGEHWTVGLCVADSDGDGKTNGDELGDVCCTWAENSGEQARVVTAISHPGFASSTTARPSCVHDTPAPHGAPTVGDVTHESVELSWAALSYDSACWCGWKVQRSADNGATFTDAGATLAFDTTHTVLTGLDAEQAYQLRVVPTALSAQGGERLGTPSPVAHATTPAVPCGALDAHNACHSAGCKWCANTEMCQAGGSECPICHPKGADEDACTAAHCLFCASTQSCHDVTDTCTNCTALTEATCAGAGCSYCEHSDLCVDKGASCECTPLAGTCGDDGCGGSLGVCGAAEVCTEARECACDATRDFFGHAGACTYCVANETCSGHGTCTADGLCACELQWAGNAACSACTDGVSGNACDEVSYLTRTVIDDSYTFVMSSLVSPDRSSANSGRSIVLVRLSSTATGYMAIGISPDGSMTNGGKGADIIAAFVDGDGEAHAYDYWATEHAPVPLDAEQNVQVLGGWSHGATTVVEFARHVATGDAAQDRAFVVGANTLIYAGGKNAPPASGVFGHPQYHRLGHGTFATTLAAGPCDPAVHCSGHGVCQPEGGCSCDHPWMTAPGDAHECSTVNYAYTLHMDDYYTLRMVAVLPAEEDPDQSPVVYMRIDTTVPTAWVAIGISTDGTMDSSGHGSDIITAFVDAAGTPHVYDYWAPRAAPPLLDTHQDVTLVRGSKQSFEFFRRANTSDPEDRVITLGEGNPFIFAARSDSAAALPPANGVFANVPAHDMGKGVRLAPMYPGMCNVAMCEHGSCVDEHGCTCDKGWEGPFCSHSAACDAATTCSGHGRCADDGTCICDAGYTTADCSVHGNAYKNSDGTWSVEWEFLPGGTDILFTIKARTGGWSAIGFNSEPLMKGADMVVAWVDGANAVVSDRHSGGHAVPDVDAHDDVVDTWGQQAGDGAHAETTWQFTRALNTGDADDMVIPSSADGYGSFYLLWAIGSADGTGGADGSFAKHTSRGAVKMNLKSGAAKGVSLTDYITPHAVLMVIGWGVCVFVGAFIARFYKHIGHKWYQAHVSLQSLGLLVAIVGLALGVKSVDRGGDHFTKTHHKLGLALMVLGVVQGFLGYLANKMWNPDRDGIPFFPDRMHWIFGYVCMALTPAAIFTGMQLRGNVSMGLVVLYAAWLGAFVALYVYKSVLALAKGQSLEHDPSMYAEMGDSGNLPRLAK